MLSCFRYTFVSAFGSWLFQCKNEGISNRWRAASFAMGIMFIVLHAYCKVRPRIITLWTGTSFMACLYLLPLAEYLIKKVRLSFAPFELLGRASFNIFLVQMVYYPYPAPSVCERIGVHVLWLLSHAAICIGAGLAFHLVEQPVTKGSCSLPEKLLRRW